MCRKTRYYLSRVVLACLLLPLSVSGAPGTLAQIPLFLSAAVEPNLILLVDDSSAMDWEVMANTHSGVMWWHRYDKSFFGRDNNDINNDTSRLNFNASGDHTTTWKRYGYLFPNGYGTSTSGKKLFSDSTTERVHAIPPTEEMAFARSPDFNLAYYNPSIKYRPWPSYSGTSFTDADPTAALYDPVNTGAGSLNLTIDFDDSHPNWGDDHWLFRFSRGMRDTNGNILGSTSYLPASYYPATYYRLAGTEDKTGYNASVSCTGCVLPDGRFLDRYEIRSGNYDTDEQYQAAIQNFANWFSYYRKRHLAIRGGLAHALQGLKGIRVGMSTTHDRQDLNMSEVDTAQDTLLQALYAYVGSEFSTPNRQALRFAGRQLQRTNAGAPIEYACQQNVTMLFTGGYSDTARRQARNEDGGMGQPYEDGISNTMADIAMKYYKSPLRGDLPSGEVPVAVACNSANPDPWLDCNRDLHMNTFAVTLGGKGRDYFGISHFNIEDAYNNPPTWYSPRDSGSPIQIDDLYHATINGRGELLSASNVAQIESKIKSTFRTIVSQTSSAASVNFSSTSFQSDSKLFLSRFNPSTWSGDLLAYSLKEDGSLSNIVWQAAEQLDGTTNQRRIITFAPDTQTSMPFNWDQLSDAQKADLLILADGSTATDVEEGKARLDYIRGEHHCERGSSTSCAIEKNLRARHSRLGDLIHSAPVYVGRPVQHWPNVSPFPESEPYSDFVNSNKTRDGLIYIGGNDGMLHAFNSHDGSERFAYIPGHLYSNEINNGLHYLSQGNYSHRYYVDQTVSVSDAYLSGWKTVLVGALGGGGRGLYALDVTTPNDFNTESGAASKVLWEFSHPDLGYGYSRTSIVPLGNSTTIDWYVIVGNGYNDSADGASDDGSAKLFIIKLSGPGSDKQWDEGVDYFIIDTQSGDVAQRNGLSTPQAVDSNGDNIADLVYAGDLFGQVWRFDVKGSPAASWDNSHSKRLFSTISQRPITSKPVVVHHPGIISSETNLPNLLVFFGSGQFLTNNDKTSTDSEHFYAVWDKGGSSENLDSSSLVEQTISLGNNDSRVISNNAVDYNGGKYGWYITLPDSGERLISDPVVRGNVVFFNTTVPETGVCSYGGYGWLNAVDQLSGGGTTNSVFDTNSDGSVNSEDLLASGGSSVVVSGQRFSDGLPQSPSFLGSKQYTTNSRGDVNVTKTFDGYADLIRNSWRELDLQQIE